MRDKLRTLWNRLNPMSSTVSSVATISDIHDCYRLLLNRKPDQSGLAHWRDMVTKHGIPVQTLVDGFIHSQEFRALQEERNRPRLVQLPDFRMYVRMNDFFVGASIAREKQYEPHVTVELRRLIKPGDTFVDIGANIGYFSLMAAILVGPQGRVIALEPSSENCDLLRRSIAENGFSNIDLHEKAASDKTGSLTFTSSAIGSNGRIVTESEASSQLFPLERVQAVRLDEALANIDRIDVIKMDIEGAEPQALDGMRHIVGRHRPTIVTEFSPELISMSSDISPESYLESLSQQHDLFVLHRVGGKNRTPQSNEEIMRIQAESGLTHLDIVAIPR